MVHQSKSHPWFCRVGESCWFSSTAWYAGKVMYVGKGNAVPLDLSRCSLYCVSSHCWAEVPTPALASRHCEMYEIISLEDILLQTGLWVLLDLVTMLVS